jgi:hypothetical protein
MKKAIEVLNLAVLLAELNEEVKNLFGKSEAVSDLSVVESKEDYFAVACLPPAGENPRVEVQRLPFQPGFVDDNSIMLYSREYLDKNCKYVRYFDGGDPTRYLNLALVYNPEFALTEEEFAGHVVDENWKNLGTVEGEGPEDIILEDDIPPFISPDTPAVIEEVQALPDVEEKPADKKSKSKVKK